MNVRWGRRRFLAAVLVLASCKAIFDGSAIPNGYLGPKDVEAATGITGIRLDKETSGAYVFVENATNRRLVQVRTGTDTDFGRWKVVAGAVRAPMTGLGSEAYQGPTSGGEPTVIALTKGDHALEISAIPDMLGASVSYEQLYRIASVAAGRM